MFHTDSWHIEPDAYVISDCGRLGAGTQCVCEGRAIYHGDDHDDCLEAIRNDMEVQRYWPDVVYVDDHGGVNPVVLS